jgi:hypothetical protein
MLRLALLTVCAFLAAGSSVAQTTSQVRAVQEMRRHPMCAGNQDMMNALPQQIAHNGYIIEQINCVARAIHVIYTKAGTDHKIDLSFWECGHDLNDESACVKADADYDAAIRSTTPLIARTSTLFGTLGSVKAANIPEVVIGGGYDCRVLDRRYYVHFLVGGDPAPNADTNAMEAFLSPLTRGFTLTGLR